MERWGSGVLRADCGQKSDSSAEVNALPLSEFKISGIPNLLKTCSFIVVSPVVDRSIGHTSGCLLYVSTRITKYYPLIGPAKPTGIRDQRDSGVVEGSRFLFPL